MAALAAAPQTGPVGVARTGGSTAAERQERYPCDELAPELEQELFRARTVAAPPQVVFRWLAQLRHAPYSYDLVDNLGRRSPRTLDPAAPPLAVGQRALIVFRVAAFALDDHLTVDTRGRWSMVMTYRVRPVPGGTRLVVKVRCGYPTALDGRLGRVLLPWGDWLMVRRQLVVLGSLAETW
jgi:hypothetical protein